MENFSKNPRGRPLTAAGGMRDWLRREFPRVGDRQRGNVGYMLTARSALGNGEEPQFDYLVGKGNARSRETILAALGRFDDEETIRRLAGEICLLKLKTAEAVRWLRSLRGVARPPSRRSLARKLGKCVGEFLQTGATVDDALAALALATRAVESTPHNGAPCETWPSSRVCTGTT